ncbi:MAG: hypothetical protein AAGE18_11850 [Pseudomonadota bacterium]
MLIRLLGTIAALGLFGLWSAPVAAQQTVAAYFAAFGPQDYVNSRGQQLDSFAAILLQDRANYHRWGRPDWPDQSDPIFADRAARAQIPALFRAYPQNAAWNQFVTPPSGALQEAEVRIYVCGRGGVLTHLIVNPANGDGYDTCEGPISAGG